MDTNNPQLNVLEGVQKFLEAKFAYAEDVASHIDRIEDLIESLESRVKEAMEALGEHSDELNEEQLNKLTSLTSAIEDIKSLLDSKVNRLKSEFGGSISSLKEELYNEVKKLYSTIESIPEPTRIDEQSLINKAVELSKEVLVKDVDTRTNGENIVENINALPTGDDRMKIDASHIKNLPVSMGSSRNVRTIYQPYIDRFSDQTDGATKTFTLRKAPLKSDTIEVFGTDFPIILDPTVDFTVAGKTLTLSDSIPAPSQGATLIVKYYA